MTEERRQNAPWVLPLVAAALSLPLFTFLFFTLPSIPDLDSYYHLAVARLYRTSGLVGAIPWARFSVLGERLGDKELFFHLLLAPLSFSSATGRVALALLNAVVVGVCGWIAVRAAGRLGALVPVWIYLTAGAFFFRAFRLRPELLALVLLLLLVHFLAHERVVAASVIAALFALSYTAFHVAIGLAGIAVAVIAVREKRWNWKLFLFPVAGTAAGLLLHPHFPDNLRVFWLQNALFFARKSSLDVGEEILAPLASDVLLFNFGWIAGLVVLWFCRSSRERAPWRRETAVFTAAAAVFITLFVFMERMAIYAIPFATLALLFRIGDSGGLAPRLNLRRGRSLPLVALLGASVLLSLPWTTRLIRTMRNDRTGIATNENEWRSMSARIPPGALVAAPWGSAEAYCFWAPQGRYLNVLDPIFMAERHPLPYRAQRAIFRGDEPDLPFVAKEVLASDYLAFRSGDADPRLVARLKHDPRIAVRHAGRDILVQFLDGANGPFVKEWRVADPRAPQRVGRYQRPGSAEAQRRGGFVELTSVAGDAPCVSASSTIDAPADAIYELASYGPAEVKVDGALRVRDASGSRAVLGEGVSFPLSAGTHTLDVVSCRGAASRRNGFYLLQR